jgi:hypothetical protein
MLFKLSLSLKQRILAEGMKLLKNVYLGKKMRSPWFILCAIFELCFESQLFLISFALQKC